MLEMEMGNGICTWKWNWGNGNVKTEKQNGIREWKWGQSCEDGNGKDELCHFSKNTTNLKCKLFWGVVKNLAFFQGISMILHWFFMRFPLVLATFSMIYQKRSFFRFSLILRCAQKVMSWDGMFQDGTLPTRIFSECSFLGTLRKPYVLKLFSTFST